MHRSFVDLALPGILCCILLSGAMARGQVETVTEPEKCLFLGAPTQLAFLQADNLVLMVNHGGVYAFDVASGAQRWHRYLLSHNGGQGAEFRKRQVLGWSEQGVFLLDAVTGKETWWRRDTPCGAVRSAHLSPDENHVLVVCEQGVLLYGVYDRTQRTLPAVRDFFGWFPDGKAMMVSDVQSGPDKTTRKWQILDTGTGKVTLRESPGSWYDPAPVFSSLGQLAEWSEKDQGGGTLKIRDARTGAVLHEFSDVGTLSETLYWLKGGRRLACLTADRKEARVIDTETGAVQFALSGDDQHFVSCPPFEDQTGAAWIFSKDSANNRHAWKLAPDGAPVKLLDGRRLAPSYFWPSSSGSGRLGSTCQEEDHLYVYSVYDTDTMNKLAEWRCQLPKPLWDEIMVNKALTHAACTSRATADAMARPRNHVFTLHVQNRETPVRTGRGEVRAISPDGKFLVVQTDDKEACLYDAENDHIFSQYAVDLPSDYPCYMPAAFSDDGKRVAVNTSKTIEVTDLSEGFPRRSMAMPLEKDGRTWRGDRLRFSPDGARLLCGGSNCARLFDVTSGTLLHTFEETERFAFPYSQGNGFWNGLVTMAKDWAGMVTDRFKYDNRLETAFVDGGSRIATFTAGQVIRVWDAESGHLLHTIHTGLPEKRNRVGYINNKIMLSANGRFAFSSNGDNFAPAVLWSVSDGTPLRRYQLPESSWGFALPTEEGKAVIVSSNMNLYRWKGVDNNGLGIRN
jgi:WD40 repeat protein